MQLDISKIESALGAKVNVNELKKTIEEISMLYTYYKCAILEVETKFKVLDEQFSMGDDLNPISYITSRLKSPESIYDKLIRKNLSLEVSSIENNINDVAGVKVICSFIDDIYMLAKCFMSQDDIKILEIKDYIETPKENGYRSLHIIVEVPIFLQQGKKNMKVEVQLRTIAMEFWADLEHKLWYKKDKDNKLLATKDELKECANLSAMLDLKMQNIRNVLN